MKANNAPVIRVNNQVINNTTEKELIHRAKMGDVSAKNKLIIYYDTYIKSFASNYAHKDSLYYDDFVQSGRIGFSEAIDAFDEAKGGSLISYARFKMMNQIGIILSKCNGIGLNTSNMKLLIEVHKKEADFLSREGRMPTLEELKELFKENDKSVSKKRILNLLNAGTGYVSIDSMDDEENEGWKNRLEGEMTGYTDGDGYNRCSNDYGIDYEDDEDGVNINEPWIDPFCDDNRYSKYNCERLYDYLDLLPDRMRDAVLAHEDLDGKKRTVNSVAKQYGVSTETIRTDYKKALNLLRGYFESPMAA